MMLPVISVAAGADPHREMCAFAGLRLTDTRAVTGEPDVWLPT